MNANADAPDPDGCLATDTVMAFRERSLDASAEERVDAHLASCTRCRMTLAEIAAMSEVPDAAPSSAVRDRAYVELPQKLARVRAAARIGSLLRGRWRIEALLGIGGTCHVFAARHRNGRRVAIKMMRPELATDPDHVRRFLREGYAANRIGHPDAVAILDDDITEDGAPFLVMEHLDGESVGSRLRREKRLPLACALTIVDATLDVLGRAHARSIVHRDVKPDNLFACTDGTIKVLDFGLARIREAAQVDEESASTSTGAQMGTVGFVSPEQARGLVAEVDARSDVWSAGATLYALLSGERLHLAPTTNAGFFLAMTKAVAPMRELLPEIPSALADVLDRALAFDQKARFEDATAMQTALRELRPYATVATTGPSKASASKGRYRLGLALGVAFALLAARPLVFGTDREHAPSTREARRPESVHAARSFELRSLLTRTTLPVTKSAAASPTGVHGVHDDHARDPYAPRR